MIGKAITTSEPRQGYGLAFVILKCRLMYIRIAILFRDTHFESHAPKILLHRCQIGEEHIPCRRLVAEQRILQHFEHNWGIGHDVTIRHKSSSDTRREEW